MRGPEEFRAWREGLRLERHDAARKLGLKKRVIQCCEKGGRDGRAFEIPKTVELACLALPLGFEACDGSPVKRVRRTEAAGIPAEA